MEFRKPILEDKQMLLDYIKEHKDTGEYNVSDMLPIDKCLEWIEKVEKGILPIQEEYLLDTYILVDNNRVLGIVSIRCNIIKEMAEIYGHIGYGVRPSERRKGYASKLNQKRSLCKCL